MPKGEGLGELEEVVLLATARLAEEAYGVAIRREIEMRSGRDVSLGAVYAALDRLERKSHLTSRLGAPTAERGGKAKRHYRLTAGGAEALRRVREIRARLWRGLRLEEKG